MGDVFIVYENYVLNTANLIMWFHLHREATILTATLWLHVINAIQQNKEVQGRIFSGHFIVMRFYHKTIY
jgi:hypothetical protein